ncbi:1-acyl-sn-glycerol-3-phosphate acyltransferase [Capsulimonas corticalis]|uniref:1-acyl-sn-glycerol-3-phosphate acyltransferase n=1 Tax=Capsulimonas corticalis TaxID=2219043 RepID=A0A402D4X1_9BACT|nr:lysophospholipid acyltransferase family protein [Capsulimonas corticalis]BDI29230.1 1-acyl-sn-glycerol-3-phosphate acyltransferase [Capsulimonas corticalis]
MNPRPGSEQLGWLYYFTRIVVKIVTALLGGATIVGRENIPSTGPVILAPNHRANIDPPYLTLLTPRQQFYMAKEELFASKKFGGFIRGLGAFPVKRGEADRAALRFAADHLKAGHILTIFPEGTRSDDGKTLLPAEKGFALLAKQTGAPIIPIAVEGTEKVLPKGSSKIHRARVILTVGKPITAQQIIEAHPEAGKDVLTLIGKEVMGEIAKLMREAPPVHTSELTPK